MSYMQVADCFRFTSLPRKARNDSGAGEVVKIKQITHAFLLFFEGIRECCAFASGLLRYLVKLAMTVAWGVNAAQLKRLIRVWWSGSRYNFGENQNHLN